MVEITKIFGKRIGIYGLGVTGKACLNYLSKHGIKPVLIDDAPREKLADFLEDYNASLGETFLGGQNFDWNSILGMLDILIISPGIKASESLLTASVNRKVPIISEIEFAYRLCKGRIIAVTGSNGKSTTVSMIHHILEYAGIRSHLVGNIGTAFITAVDDIDKNDIVVLELSSYQLEYIDKFKPYIAMITNITEDHLLRHGDMDSYIRAKGRIFRNQDFNDHAILNHEDLLTWKAYANAISSIHVFTFEDVSILPARELINGRDVNTFAALKDNTLIIKAENEIDTLLTSDELAVPGNHNIENALCSALSAWLFNVPANLIGQALREFKGIAHRIEYLGEINGAKVYNDSKATNVDSTITALKTFTERFLHLILGGSEKDSNFAPLWEFLKEREDPFKLYLTGPSGKRMASELNNTQAFDSELFDSFDTCADAALRGASEGHIVLLSPACASFDEFRNFEQRGDRFKKLFSNLLKGEVL